VSGLCKKCGSLLAEGAVQCAQCGAPVAVKTGTSCAKCGYVLLPGLTFCPSCGTNVPPAEVKPAVA
jgi:uncharacterized OB-fold protein